MIDQTPIRAVLQALNPAVAHKAADKPEISEIYTPRRHANALDPDRALVIGSRGVGKSFWASVLSDDEARLAAAQSYPTLGLDRLDAALGFHEGALGSDQIAPSPTSLKAALRVAEDPISIWRSVLLKVIDPVSGPVLLRERVEWIEKSPEFFEDRLLKADKDLVSAGRRRLVVFDALDVLANDWETIRTLTRALARFALEISSRRAMRLKLFMRRDQFEDMQKTTFADFSKLKTAAVQLVWFPVDLYGVLFTRLLRHPISSETFSQLTNSSPFFFQGSNLPDIIKISEGMQEILFAKFASEFMGANKKRGRTYIWVPKHLADAHGETSLRSFLIALKEAADRAGDRPGLAIDHQGINAGVLKASDTRLDELREDHPWVDDALEALEGLTVPCDAGDFLSRWKERDVLARIRARTDPQRPAAPIQLEVDTHDPQEAALMDALKVLGVLELRGSGRVNVPDIFRVAARMKRRGGVAPRRRS